MNDTSRSEAVKRALSVALGFVKWAALALFVIVLLSGFKEIQPNEVAIVLRFGKIVGKTPADRIKQPGLLYVLPEPIDQVIRVPIGEEMQVIISELWAPLPRPKQVMKKRTEGQKAGIRITKTGLVKFTKIDTSKPVSEETEEIKYPDTIDPLKEGYVVTGDQSILQIRLVAKYKISDPIAFVFSSINRDETIRDAVMAALTETVAGWDIDDALHMNIRDPETGQVVKILPLEVKQVAQERLDKLDLGVKLTSVEFTDNHVPRQVYKEYKEAQDARIEADTKKQEAEGYAASLIPQAEADRDGMIKDAMAYRSEAVSTAQAEYDIFRNIYSEYQKAPDLIRQRLYLEAVEAMLESVGKRVYLPVDEGHDNARILIAPESEATKDNKKEKEK